MLILDGQPISPDAPFTHEGTNYPANWIRLATPEEKEAIGLTEIVEEPKPDEFYNLVLADPVNHGQWIVTPYPPEQMKSRLAQYSRQQRGYREMAGIEHTVAGKVRLIPTDPATRSTFFDMRVVIARPGPTPPTVYDFRGMDGGEVVTVPEAQVLLIEQKMEDRVSGCAQAQLELQVQINAGTVTTKEEIDAAYAAVP